MAKYLSAILAFAAALTGIFGDSHDATRTGFASITPLGWVAIGAALLSLVVVLVETHRDHSKINWQARQRETVRRIANQQVMEAVRHFLGPFNVLIREVWTRRQGLDVDLDQLDKDSTYLVNLLSNATIRGDLLQTDLRSKANVHPPTLWWEFLAKKAVETRSLLNDAAGKYSGYLDSNTLVAIEELRADELVSFRLPTLGDLQASNKHITPFPLADALDPVKGTFANLDQLLAKLRTLIDATAAQNAPT